MFLSNGPACADEDGGRLAGEGYQCLKVGRLEYDVPDARNEQVSLSGG